MSPLAKFTLGIAVTGGVVLILAILMKVFDDLVPPTSDDRRFIYGMRTAAVLGLLQLLMAGVLAVYLVIGG